MIELAGQIASTGETGRADVAQILMRAATRTGETVIVARRSESGPAILVAAAPSPHPLRVCVTVGTPVSLADTSAGRVLLAWQEHATIQAALTAVPPAPGPVAMLELFGRLRTIRDHGYDTATHELGTDIWTVTAPIRTATTITGSLTIATPTTWATPRHRDYTTATAVEIADALAALTAPQL